MHAVSYTAQWMAAARALESEREDALYVDPLARALAEPKGFELIDRYAGGDHDSYLEEVGIRRIASLLV